LLQSQNPVCALDRVVGLVGNRTEEKRNPAVPITVFPGKSCERQALREMGVAGQTNVGDRYYGEDYQLLGEIDQAAGFFVFRIKENAVVHVEEELPLNEADRAAGLVQHRWARLGAHEAKRSIRLRLVEIKAADQHLLLVTNLPLATAPAELIGLIYRRRWAIELFFRWIKCILGCRHFFAESPQRVMELIQFYLMGWATAADLVQLLNRQIARATAAKRR